MENEFFDVSSSTKEATDNQENVDTKNKKETKLPQIKLPVIKETGFKSLGNIIKIIAFVIAFAVIGVHALAAYILFAFRPLYLTVCIAIVAFGFAVSLIILFLIYALGHCINQNNEIISLLKNNKEK